MKNKYQRMNKEEKKQIYNEYKNIKPEFIKKMERLLLICKLGIIYCIIAIPFDLLINKSIPNVIIDGIILLFSILMLIKTNYTKIEFLNDYAIKKDKKYKEEIVRKNKKNK